MSLTKRRTTCDQERVIRGGGDWGFSAREIICGANGVRTGTAHSTDGATCRVGITNCATLIAVSSAVLQQEILQSDMWSMPWPQSIGISFPDDVPL